MGYPGKADHLILGDFNAICYECGRKFKGSQLIRHWQGYYVCKAHFEPRQPQDFVRNVLDNQTPPWTQPPADTFKNFCDLESRNGICDVGTADCAICDFTYLGS